MAEEKRMSEELERELSKPLDELAAFARGESDESIIAYRRDAHGEIRVYRYPYSHGIGKRCESETSEDEVGIPNPRSEKP